MLNPYRLKALEGLLDYLSGVQGGDLKSLLDESQKPKEGDPLEESMESPDVEMMEGDNPKGISVEKVSLMGKPMEKADAADKMADNMPENPSEIDATPDELEELYNKFRK